MRVVERMRLMLAGLLACGVLCGSASGTTAVRRATDGYHPTLPPASWGMVNHEDGWGVDGRAILRTTDDGATWVDVTPRHFPAELAFDGVSPVDAATAWVTYDSTCTKAYCGTGGVLRTTDGGIAWQAIPLGPANVPRSELPPLKSLLASLSSGRIQDALIEGSTNNSPSFALLKIRQIDQVVGWLRSAPITARVQQCASADPMPLGGTLYLNIRGIGGALDVTGVMTCTVGQKDKSTALQFSLSKTCVEVSGYGPHAAWLTSPGLATFLIRQSVQAAA